MPSTRFTDSQFARLVPLLAFITFALCPAPATAQLGDSTPSQLYYVGIEELYQGEYRDAFRIFRREWNSAIKTVNARWIDSIAYHTQLGETLYHQGNREAALEQFDLAANMYLQYPDWMLQVVFDRPLRPDPTLARRIPPWGRSSRNPTLASFPTSMRISQGRLNNANAVRQGGVVQQAQFWQINAVEILRTTAITIRRRNELLGPLAPHDPISKSMLLKLSKGGAPPNHWSNAWIDILRGLAHAGVGETEQAVARLQRGLLIAGQYDHPLTSYSLLEQGRLQMLAGNAANAEALFAEASISAYVYEDSHVLDEAIRYAGINRLASGGTLNPALEPASLWARRERLDHIYARLKLDQSDQLLSSGDLRAATAAMSAAQSRMSRDIQAGVLGVDALYLAARLDFAASRKTAPNLLSQAVQRATAVAPWNLQIALANDRFDSRVLSSSAAVAVYDLLLSDPSAADTALRPLETLAVMKTNHQAAFDRWMAAVLERRNNDAALQVADQAKRRRYYQSLGWGGRLAAVRHLAVARPEHLSPERLQQQNDLLRKYPDLAAAIEAAQAARQELRQLWRPASDADAQKQAGRQWSNFAKAVDARETLLRRAAAERSPADYAFPPTLSAAQLRAALQPGQALLVFHETPAGMFGFLFTREESTHWQCAPATRLGELTTRLLQDIGNNDGNREITAEQLASNQWQSSAAALYEAIFQGSFFDPASTEELIVVPDGLLWYVPFEALTAASQGTADPLVAITPIRYAPTAGLAFRNQQPWRRVQRTGIHVGDIVGGDSQELRDQYLAPLRRAVDGAVSLTDVPASSVRAAALLDGLIVLDDVETEVGDLSAVAPLPIDRGAEGSLRAWQTLAGEGPQRMILAGLHTPAERAGKTSRRRTTGVAPGQELFLTSCTMMSAGVETLLLSRWRVGGQSMLELVREYAQELPYAPPADAWQRSVELFRETPIDPLTEYRVKVERGVPELTGAHPFFWSGYMVLDTGGAPPEAEDPL